MGLKTFLFGRKNAPSGHDIMYYREARKLLNRHYLSRSDINLTAAGPSAEVTRVLKEVIGEGEYQRYLARGWTLVQAESPSYGQLFQHRYMMKNYYQLKHEVEAWEQDQHELQQKGIVA